MERSTDLFKIVYRDDTLVVERVDAAACRAAAERQGVLETPVEETRWKGLLQVEESVPKVEPHV